MKSKVYFIPVNNKDNVAETERKLVQLLTKSGLPDVIKAGQRAVLKMHFGEEGNTGYVKPEYIRAICGMIIGREAVPVLSDTNTLYRGRRINSQDHLQIAAEHGFTKENTGAEIIIPEDSPQTVSALNIQQRYIKTAKIHKIFIEADVLLDVSHFKGHLMTGFGGALKNIGMGCASREGKLAQHSSISPYVIEDKCVACGSCAAVCPVDAVAVRNDKARIDNRKCIGCASCIAACNYEAIDVRWESGASTMQEKMIEYAKAVLDNRRGPTLYLNFAVKITKECDCLAKDDPRICPDIGIFASLDPVGIDKACYDLVIKAAGQDVVKKVHPAREGMRQLRYAAELKMGHLDYDLVEIPAS